MLFKSSLLAVALVASSAVGQMTTQGPQLPQTGLEVQAHSAIPPSAAGSTLSKAIRSTYILGADDQITVHALDAEEISEKPMRIDMSGYIRLPLVGRILAAGLTVEQLENEIAARLRKYIKEPDVAVSVLEFRSQPISVIGSVKAPGVYQLQGHKTLVECLSVAGGASDDAGYSVKITRRLEWGPLPLPSAVTDPTGHFSIAQVKLAEIIAARNPAENILILPEDIISVPRGEMVYVIGTVPRAGGFVLHERETLSVLQALALAGGADHNAAPQKARILRAVGNGKRIEIPVNLRTVMAGKSGDLPLQAEDILLVPSSTSKVVVARIAEAALQMGTLSVYRF
jgi:polysaccharide export outer membrane protein